MSDNQTELYGRSFYDQYAAGSSRSDAGNRAIP